MHIRQAKREDAALILSFIKELAEYEHMSDCVIATPELIAEQLFDNHAAEVIFAVEDDVEVGFALFFSTFSTFLGRAGMHLEDVYVKPEHRGNGYGIALLSELARICISRDYGRLEWQCLDWNEPSIKFYHSLGAEQLDDWIDFRVSGQTLSSLAEQQDVQTGQHDAHAV